MELKIANKRNINFLLTILSPPKIEGCWSAMRRSPIEYPHRVIETKINSSRLFTSLSSLVPPENSNPGIFSPPNKEIEAGPDDSMQMDRFFTRPFSTCEWPATSNVPLTSHERVASRRPEMRFESWGRGGERKRQRENGSPLSF